MNGEKMVKKNQGKQTKVKGLLFGLIALLVFTATAGQIDLSKFDPNNLETIVDIFNEPKKTYPSLEALPEFDGSHYVVEINQNKPNFTEAELSIQKVYWQHFSNLDALNRVGQADAMLQRDFMPTEKRGDISSVRPTGWKQKKMQNGDTLYNRSHLIAHQFTGENANLKNLMTGTQYMNQVTMKEYEQVVAKYLKSTTNHIRYRVTPYFKNTEIVARGVQIEAQSIEDNEVSFNVFLYNVQPGYTIDYQTGESKVIQ